MSYQTAFTAPHYKAAQVGQQILDAGGTASEAMVAAAAMVAVQYPHMNSLGGDGFWLIAKQGEAPVAIDACGGAAIDIDVARYQSRYTELPDSGGEAAITMAGTVAGWQQALAINGGKTSLQDLLFPAKQAAQDGITVTQSLVDASVKTADRLSSIASFSELYLPKQRSLEVGDVITNASLAGTLDQLATAGLDDFYRGDLASQMALELRDAGSPLSLSDFNRYHAKFVTPLTVKTSKGQLYNLGAPTQGLASLQTLAIYDRLIQQANDSGVQLDEKQHIHLLVEATKQAFMIRDRVITDANYLEQPLQTLLQDELLDACAAQVNTTQARVWPHQAKPGDTVWMGAVDSEGTMVSFIQSIYWEFGSGVVLPSSGVLWNCRGKSFSLDPNHHNALVAGKKPFHTLNPAYAELHDGRRMVYGSMGGEGQPQTQACLFSRYLYQQHGLADAISRPRWLLGRTWGDDSHSLRMEQSLYDDTVSSLTAMGHEMVSVDDNNELMGHAGAVVSSPSGEAIAATDPRSDGQSIHGVVTHDTDNC